MFEIFNVPKLYMINSALLSLYQSGETTGIVSESGSATTSAVPIYEGYTLKYAINTTDLGGRQLTKYLNKSLKEKQYFF